MAGVEGLPAAEVDMEEEAMIEEDMAPLEVAIVEDTVVGPEDTHRIKNLRSHRPWNFGHGLCPNSVSSLLRAINGCPLVICVLQRHKANLARLSCHVLRSRGIEDLRFL